MNSIKDLAKKKSTLKELLQAAERGDMRLESEDEQFEGFVIPNTTQTPNELYDKLLPDLTEAQLKVLLYLIRKTYGYSKSEGDFIPLSQILTGTKKKDGTYQDRGTGLARRSALRALKALEAVKLISVTRGRDIEGLRKTNFYRANVKGFELE